MVRVVNFMLCVFFRITLSMAYTAPCDQTPASHSHLCPCSQSLGSRCAKHTHSAPLACPVPFYLRASVLAAPLPGKIFY